MFIRRVHHWQLHERILIPAVLLVLIAAAGVCQGDIIGLLSGADPIAPEPGAVVPQNVVSLGKNAWIGETVTSRDGRYVYVLVVRYGANPLSIAAFHWPELSAIVCIVLWFMVNLKIKHEQQRRKQDGTPFCMGCGYQLTGVKSSTCPECGLELNNNNIQRGRPMFVWERCRFFTIPFILSIVIVTEILLIGRIDLPRMGRACSPDLYELAMINHRPLLGSHRQLGEQMARIDTSTGRVQYFTSHLQEGLDQLRLINADKTLLYLDDHHIKCRDVETGRFQEVFAHPEGELHFKLTVDPKSQQLLASNKSRGFDTWDLQTGEPGSTVPPAPPPPVAPALPVPPASSAFPSPGRWVSRLVGPMWIRSVRGNASCC